MSLYRLSFARRGACAWVAHLDLMRIFERAFRRTALPLKWSQGFNPRPSMVFALPLGVGIEAEAEFMELELEEEFSEEEILRRLEGAFPENLRVFKAERREAEKESLMSQVSEAVYRYEGTAVGRAFRELWAENTAILLKLERKGKERELNLRELILEAELGHEDSFRLRCQAGSRGNMRPDLPLQALEKTGKLTPDQAADVRIVRECLLLKSLEGRYFDAPAKQGL